MKRKAPTTAGKRQAKRMRRFSNSNPGYGNFYGGLKAGRPEKKVFDVSPATISVDTTGNFTLLHVPILGSDFNARVGRKTLVKNIQIRGQVQLTPTTSTAAIAATTPQTARMIVLVDLQPNAAAPALADVLTGAAFGHLNLDNRDRFKILRDKIFPLGPLLYSNTATQSYAGINQGMRNFKFYIPCNQEVIFNGTNGGTIADITSGAIYVLWVGSVAAGALDSAAVITTRTRFVDS